MKVSNVTKEDGIAVAHLLNTIKVARFDNLTGEDIERLVGAKRWLHGIAMEMAAQLKTANSSAPQGGMKVKAMGALPSKLKVKKKK